MIIRILILVVMLVLVGVARFFNKNSELFSTTLNHGEASPALATRLRQLATAYLLIAGLGIICLVFPTKLYALIYLALILVISALYSLKISQEVK